ncbi:penicillin-binding protein PBP1A [Streptococcus cuniculipharyngis]|uniref:PBP1A family penicillin-binding protein n=1 Tax=Streptococcus cuniculipharyngis TaxID=1562651 RepID=A0A5C5SCU9_9STRE|nr:penicillin-binding protein PBP1A [Streptococcus cuniculipharyngis]TWS98112.1 PBP1A family penicillin-binding protein [Streptococcus cuniculipharyngis]
MIIINSKSIIKIFKYAIGAILSVIILAVVLGGLLFAFYAITAPSLSEDKLRAVNSSLVFDSQGNQIADLGAEQRESVTADSIPVNLVNAITSIEDRRFFEHRGIDIFRILGSAVHNLTSNTTQGGSTLDQQLIKLAYFSTDEKDQTIKRKAQEAWLSLQMERKYTKQEILTFYINKVYMGNGYYGMRTAAKNYYGKDLPELSIAQLALLAGIPQAPSQYDPYTNAEAAKGRRDTVLAQMYNYGRISEKDYQEAVATPVEDGLQALQKKISYEKYLDNYLKQVIQEIQDKTGKDIFTSGLKVYTNVNADLQRYLWDVYNTYDYIAYPDDQMQVASTIMDVTNGQVIAQLGARNQDESISFGTNQAVLTDRDWASTMKPITDYAPALDTGAYTSTAQATNDSVYFWPGTDIQVYNWDRQYYGWMTIQTALMQSRNIPAIRALEAAGLDQALKFLNGLGIDYPELLYSNAISSNTSVADQKYGASSEKMAAAYAAFANGGTYYKPQYVNKIEFNDGSVKTYKPEGNRAMKETTAYMMTDMLKTVLSYGTGTEAAIGYMPQAGKTGTSNYSDEELDIIAAETGLYTQNVGTIAPDSNFVGYTSQYSMAVWTGYKNRLTPLYGNGLKIAAQVYRTAMSYLTGGYSDDWEMPAGMYRSGGMLYLDGYNSNNKNYYTPPKASRSNHSQPTTSSSEAKSSSSQEKTSSSDNKVSASASSSALESSTETSISSKETTETPASSAKLDTDEETTDFDPIYSSTPATGTGEAVNSISGNTSVIDSD